MATAVFTTSGAGSWTIPGLGVGTPVQIEAWGAGSGASGGSSSFASGGGAGDYVQCPYILTAADIVAGTISFTVGAGSAGTGAANPAAGGDTTVKSAPTNRIPNSEYFADIVTGTVGSGGKLPQGWLFTGNGLSVDVNGSGFDSNTGRTYVILRFHGTATSSANSKLHFSGTNSASAVLTFTPFPPSTAYNHSVYTAKASDTGGTAFPAAASEVDWYNASATAMTYVSSTFAATPNATTTLTRVGGSSTSPAAVTSPDILFQFAVVSGSSYDATWWFAGPQFSSTSTLQTYQATPTGYLLAKGSQAPAGTTAGRHSQPGNCAGCSCNVGGDGRAFNASGCGGGGAGGPDGAGATSVSATGGTGDNGNVAAGASDVRGGGGGTGVVGSGAGGAGGLPGAGGGASTTGTGGAGANGQVRFTFTLPLWGDSALVRIPELPVPPQPLIRAGSIVVAAPSAPVPRVATTQEYPRHPLPTTLSGLQGPDVAPPPQIGSIFLGPEPGRAGQFASWSGVAGPNVRPPVTDRLQTVQESPYHPPPALRTGVSGPNVRPPVADRVQTTQQLPDHPLPRGLPGVQGPDVRSPVLDRILTTQEAGRVAQFVSWSGVQGPNVRPPVFDTALLRQELPPHPLPALRVGVSGPNVAPPPLVGAIILRQDTPSQPLPVVQSGQLGAVAPTPPQVGSVLSRQELPIQPLPTLWSSVPSIRQPDGFVYLRQEWPAHPLPNLQSGQLQGLVAGAVPPVTSVAILRQQLPDHPLSLLRVGISGPSVRSPTLDWTLGRQQLPDHPLPSLTGGLLPNQRRQVTDTALIRQLLPDHPLSTLLAGVQSQVSAPVPASWVLMRQESPQQVASALRAGLAPSAGLPALGVLVRQEMPTLLQSVTWPGVYVGPVLTLAAPLGWVFTRQYLPWHPLPLLLPAHYASPPVVPPVVPPYVRGRTVRLLSEPPQLAQIEPVRLVRIPADPQPSGGSAQGRVVRIRPEGIV